MKKDLVCFLESIIDYERESSGRIADDNRSVDDIVDEYLRFAMVGSLAQKHLNDIIEMPSRTLKQKTIQYTAIQRRAGC